jgi:hypothetical protein
MSRHALAGSLIALGAAATGGFFYAWSTDVHPLVTIALLALALQTIFKGLAVLNARPARREVPTLAPDEVWVILIETGNPELAEGYLRGKRRRWQREGDTEPEGTR